MDSDDYRVTVFRKVYFQLTTKQQAQLCHPVVSTSIVSIGFLGFISIQNVTLFF